jgi:hypothetical protein
MTPSYPGSDFLYKVSCLFPFREYVEALRVCAFDVCRVAQCVQQAAAHCETQCASRRDFYTKSCVSRFLIDLSRATTLSFDFPGSRRPYWLSDRCREMALASSRKRELSLVLRETSSQTLEARTQVQEFPSAAA